MKCSTNLTKHLKLLKQEHNRLECMILNREKLDKTEVEQHLEHRSYVRKLLHQEKMKAFSKKLLTNGKD